MRILTILVCFLGHPTTQQQPTPTIPPPYHPLTHTTPFFEPNIETNLSTQVGSTVFLPCRVRNLGNKSVTWLRSRDAHILTVDRFLFISDARFTLHHPSPSTFTLAIRHAQPRDSGVYECQVTTSPKSSLLFTLDVVTPQTRILGEPDVFVQSGSLLSLKCVIYDALEEPEYVFWFHDGARLLSFSALSFSSQSIERLTPDTTLSTLTVFEIGREDGGNYSCAPRALETASVMVHVLGEHPAAMQQSNENNKKNEPNTCALGSSRCIILIFCLLINLQ